MLARMRRAVTAVLMVLAAVASSGYWAAVKVWARLELGRRRAVRWVAQVQAGPVALAVIGVLLLVFPFGWMWE